MIESLHDHYLNKKSGVAHVWFCTALKRASDVRAIRGHELIWQFEQCGSCMRSTGMDFRRNCQSTDRRFGNPP